jgi:hypothetical protein
VPMLLASKRSRHGGNGGGEGVPTRRRRRQRQRRGLNGGGDNGVPAVAACAPVAFLAVRWWFGAREMKFCEVIQAERRVLDL